MTSPTPDAFDDQLLLRLQGAAMDQAGEAVIILADTTGASQGRRVVSVNRSFVDMTGYAPGEITGETLYVLKGPDTNQEALDRISAAMQSGERITEDILNYRKDGSTFWARCTLAPVRISGEPMHWVSVLRDITAEREAKIRAEKSEAQYRALVSSFPNGAIFLFNHQLRFTLAGGEALRAVGFDSATMIGQRLSEVLPQEYVDRVQPLYEATLAGKRSELEVSLEGRTYETQFVPVTDEQNEVVAGMIVAVDVTSRRREKRQLAESETRYRIVAENMRDLVCLHRPDGSVEWVSPSVEPLLGHTPETFSALPIQHIVHPRDLDRLWSEGFDPVLNGASGTRGTFRLQQADGTPIWFEIMVRPVLDDDGRVIKLLTTSRDVTEQKEFENRLVRAKEHAEKMNRLKTAFLANMSHEIRTPLTNVIGFADVLASEVSDPQLPFVQHIQKGGRRLLHTLNSVLDHAQLESETVRIRPSRVSLTELVSDAASFFRPQTEYAGIDMRVVVPRGPVYVYTDPGAIERVINNLLSNAIKFTPEGSVTVRLLENPLLSGPLWERYPTLKHRADRSAEETGNEMTLHGASLSDEMTIRVNETDSSNASLEPTLHWVTAGDARPDDLAVEIQVMDTGVGIDESFLPHLFVPFEQESTGLSRSFEGTGLGLSICARLVHMLGGVISAETTKGSGSTFRVFLPRSLP
jgi:PAS domain S-box-containing protein